MNPADKFPDEFRSKYNISLGLIATNTRFVTLSAREKRTIELAEAIIKKTRDMIGLEKTGDVVKAYDDLKKIIRLWEPAVGKFKGSQITQVLENLESIREILQRCGMNVR